MNAVYIECFVYTVCLPLGIPHSTSGWFIGITLSVNPSVILSFFVFFLNCCIVNLFLSNYLQVEESDHAKMAVANSFAIYGGNKCILVAARYVS